MVAQISKLKNKLLRKDSLNEKTVLTDIVELIRSFGCMGEILGREFEVFDNKENLVYIIRQKPIKLLQLNILMKELNLLKRIDAEIEAKKFGGLKSKK